MCGIVGSLNWQQSDPESLIQQMTEALSHRGPDAQNIISLGPLVLGHRRLSVIDIRPSANQPLSDHSQRFWIVFNGEIYNYQALRRELTRLGHRFVTESDTEVILEAWRRWQTQCIDHLIGMFAFALWDTEKNSLFIARDRLGEKPLYYKMENHASCYNLIFASELSALRLHPSISREVNPKALNQFLSLNYTLTNASMIAGVEKLAPGHFLYLEQGKEPLLKQYWNLKDHFQRKTKWQSEEEAKEQLTFLLDSSVAQQSVSDVPLGAFLSGGIDSSSLVASLKQQDKAKIQTFSIGFQEKTYSELEESKKIAHYLDVEHHTKIVKPNLAKMLPQILKKLDEPLADSSLIPMYFLAEFAKEHVTVALSGDGGDELFLGYETYTADKLYHFVNKFPKKCIQFLSHAVNHYMPVSHAKISVDYKLKQFLKGCLFNFRTAHYSWRTIFSEEEKKIILRKDYAESVLLHDPFQQFNHFFEEVLTCHPLDQASYVDMKTWLVDDILVKVDRTAMAHSLETRAPFLDHRLVEFAASLPVSLKMRGLQKKYLLKQSQYARLPKAVLQRPKKGFNAPISQWLMGDLKSLAQEVTLDPLLKTWFNPLAIESLWKDHLSLKQDQGLKLFGLTCFGLWALKLNSFS